MRASTLQLFAIENLKKNYLITVNDYGFYSNGTISVNCSDIYGDFAVTINSNGTFN